MGIKNVYLGQVLKLTLFKKVTLNKVMYCGVIITSELLDVKNSKDKQKN